MFGRGFSFPGVLVEPFVTSGYSLLVIVFSSFVSPGGVWSTSAPEVLRVAVGLWVSVPTRPLSVLRA